MSLVESGIRALWIADRDGDADAMGELLAPDAVFKSPFASSVRFEGRDEIVALHRDVFKIVVDRESSDPLVGGNMGCFNFSARVRGKRIDAVCYATFNEQGEISELKVYGRPLASMAELFLQLPPRVSRRRGGPVKSLLTAAGARIFWVLATVIERAAPFLIPIEGAIPMRSLDRA